MVKIFIDDKPVKVKEGTTVLSAAKQAGISIPHFCFHSALAPEGSCRMCLIEIEGVPKLELACSTQVRDEMKVWTQSERVVEARKGVLEFLLAEHPLDCPICDKAGECKLQDYYEEYGLFDSQFKELKEKRDKKANIGKSLILDRERCILCTRCVRFLREIVKTQELGVFNRGNRSEIDTYEGELVNNNYSGNLVELCPVGAITDSDFRFQIRSWFLKKDDSICPLCSRGCNISIEYHDGFARIPRKKRVYRIIARENPDVNRYWICDLGRYEYSYLDEKRLENLLIINEERVGSLDWEKAIQFMAQEIKRLYQMKKTSRIVLIINSWLSNEELFLVRKIFKEDLSLKRIYVAEPSQGKGDDFLLTPERSPNRRGVTETGFDLRAVNLEELADRTDIIIIFGDFLLEQFGIEDVKAALDKIKTKILFSYKDSELSSLADLVLPTALIAEKSGSLTNFEGEVQRFEPALEPLGKSRPEWQILVDLAGELKIDSEYFRQLSSPSAILERMKEEIPFFRK